MSSTKFDSVVVLSDVSVGYGTPQVLSISRSLAAYGQASVEILEPDQPERPPRKEAQAEFSITRLFTANHPYTLSGQIEYCLQAAKLIDKFKPDVVVLCSFLGSGAILRMKHTPRLVIYYALEHTDGERVREQRMLKLIAPRIDIVVFPEENRALLDGARLDLRDKPTAIVYNGSSIGVEPVPWQKRNGRIFYGGLLHPELTYSDYYFGGDMDRYPIDLFGLIDGYSDPDEMIASISDRQSRVRYHGYAPGGEDFLRILREYNYSIVMWAPLRESTRFAAPNKFFDAIQARVPVICAPHPLCERLVRLYGCGIMMGGWSLDDAKMAFDEAARSYATGLFAEMVEDRLPRAAQELSWDRQFEKLWTVIEEVWAAKTVGTGKLRGAPAIRNRTVF